MGGESGAPPHPVSVVDGHYGFEDQPKAPQYAEKLAVPEGLAGGGEPDTLRRLL